LAKLIKKLIEVPLWERPVMILVGGDKNDIQKVALDMKCDRAVMDEIERDNAGTRGTAAAAYFCTVSGNGILWFPSRRIPASLLAHELTHLVDGIFEYIGAVREYEARAYTMEWLMTNVPAAIKT
jgi:hypothetical protein